MARWTRRWQTRPLAATSAIKSRNALVPRSMAATRADAAGGVTSDPRVRGQFVPEAAGLGEEAFDPPAVLLRLIVRRCDQAAGVQPARNQPPELLVDRIQRRVGLPKAPAQSEEPGKRRAAAARRPQASRHCVQPEPSILANFLPHVHPHLTPPPAPAAPPRPPPRPPRPPAPPRPPPAPGARPPPPARAPAGRRAGGRGSASCGSRRTTSKASVRACS